MNRTGRIIVVTYHFEQQEQQDVATASRRAEAIFSRLQGMGVIEVTWQLERSPLTGSLHIQGAFRVENPIRLSGAIKMFGERRAHLEIGRGTWMQNVAYCTKDQTRVDGPWHLARGDVWDKRGVESKGVPVLESKRSDAVVEDPRAERQRLVSDSVGVEMVGESKRDRREREANQLLTEEELKERIETTQRELLFVARRRIEEIRREDVVRQAERKEADRLERLMETARSGLTSLPVIAMMLAGMVAAGDKI